MAGVAGFGPTNARVKVVCLTTWLHPYKICDKFCDEYTYLFCRSDKICRRSLARAIRLRLTFPENQPPATRTLTCFVAETTLLCRFDETEFHKKTKSFNPTTKFC